MTFQIILLFILYVLLIQNVMLLLSVFIDELIQNHIKWYIR